MKPSRGNAKTLNIDRLAVAYLFATGKMSQTVIGKMLGLDEPRVCRLLKEARVAGWLRPKEQLVFPLSAAEKARIEARVFSSRFRETLVRFAKQSRVRPVTSVRVFPSRAGESWERRLHEFGQEAAGHALELISHSRVLGTAWGSTPAAIVEGIRNLGASRGRTPMKFVPLCGEPLGGDLTNTSASWLANELASIVRGNARYALSLHNVPALIPADFATEEIDVVYKLLARVPAYVQIFGSRRTHTLSSTSDLDQVDTVLTSISPEEQPWGSRSGALLGSAGVGPADLKEVCVGDIAGILLPAPNEEAISRVARLMRNWTGVQLGDLQRVATEGQVIVAAIGANKARVLLEVLRSGLCTHLLVDGDLFDALLPVIHAELQPTSDA